MSTRHETKADAEAEVERLKQYKPLEFCPLTRKYCHPNCVCYMGPYMKKHDSSPVHYVYSGCCNNAMFFNQCSCQG